MATDVLSRKIGRHFDLIDTNGDGKIDRSDFDLIVSRLTQEFGQAPGTPKHSALSEAYGALWAGMQASMDVNADGSVSREEYVRGLESDAISSYRQFIAPVTKAILDLCDVDADGRISNSELGRIHQALSMDSRDHEAAMRALDVNGDGYISEAELAQAIEEYFASDDPQAKGNYLFGAL